jgi:hypothetical protein
MPELLTRMVALLGWIRELIVDSEGSGDVVSDRAGPLTACVIGGGL